MNNNKTGIKKGDGETTADLHTHSTSCGRNGNASRWPPGAVAVEFWAFLHVVAETTNNAACSNLVKDTSQNTRSPDAGARRITHSSECGGRDIGNERHYRVEVEDGENLNGRQ